MKKMKLILIMLVLFMYGCRIENNNHKENSINLTEQEYESPDTIPVMPDEQRKTELNPGIKKEYIPKNNQERLICKVLKDYFEYAINGLCEKCVQSTYVDVFTYIQQQFPNMTMKEVKQNFAKMHKDMDFRGLMNNTIDYLGMESGEIVISDVKECVKEEKRIIYIGYTVTQFYGTYDYYTAPAEPMLIISLDNGNSWKLATPSIDTSKILEYKFSRQSIEKVLFVLNN